MGRVVLRVSSTDIEAEPEDELDLEPPAPKLKNFEDVRQFLDSKGYSSEATAIASSVDMVTALHCRARQSSQTTQSTELSLCIIHHV